MDVSDIDCCEVDFDLTSSLEIVLAADPVSIIEIHHLLEMSGDDYDIPIVSDTTSCVAVVSGK